MNSFFKFTSHYTLSPQISQRFCVLTDGSFHACLLKTMSSVLTQPTDEGYESMGKCFYQMLMTLASEVSHGWQVSSSLLDFLFSVVHKRHVLSCHGTLFSSAWQYYCSESSFLKLHGSFVCATYWNLNIICIHIYSDLQWLGKSFQVSCQWYQMYSVKQLTVQCEIINKYNI